MAVSSNNFDALSYLAANPDLARAFGLDLAAATQHYTTNGQSEGRTTAFDSLSYLSANADLIRAFGADTTAAARHYVSYGQNEGRTAAFDALGYLSANADLIRAFGADTTAATRHYVTNGYAENRSTYFNAGGYMAANADVLSAVGGDLDAARLHYIQHGFREGRQFQVDDYAENTTTLGRVVAGSRTTGMIERAYDIDWLQVPLTGGATYTVSVRFATAGLHDVALIDAFGNTLKSDGDSDGDGVHTVTYAAAGTGSAYVAVSGFDTGLYTVTTTSSGGGTTTTTSTVTAFGDLPADPTTPGRLTLGGSVSGLFEMGGDKDWYAVALEAGITYRFDGTGTGYAFVHVYNANGDRIEDKGIFSGSASTSGALFTPSATDTYYVQIESGLSTGPYTLSAAIGDDFGDDKGTKAQLAEGGSVSGAINYSGDKDWFALSLERGSTYRFDLSSTATYPMIRLYDSAGYRVWTDMVYMPSGGGSQAEQYTVSTTGTYYLEVDAGYTGAYLASLTRTAVNPSFADDFGDTPGTAGQMAMNATTDGRSNFRKDIDTFTVSLEQGKNYTFTVDAPTLGTIDFEIHSPGDDDAYVRPTVENGRYVYNYTACTTGTFFIDMSSSDYKYGAYAITATDNGMRDDYSGSTATAGRLGIGDSVTGRIDFHGVDEYRSDSDWIAVSLEVGKKYGFTLQNNQARAQLSLRDWQGKDISSVPYVDSAGNFGLQYAPLHSGTYFLDVAGQNAGSSTTLGTYTLSSRLLSGGSASSAMPLLALGG